MKKILAGMFALTLITSTVVLADNGKATKKVPVSCSKSCPGKTTCKPGTACAVMPGCVCK